MAKDYRKKNMTRSTRRFSTQLTLVLVSFLSGYLGASVFDLTSLSGWVNRQLLAHQAVPAANKKTIQRAELPKPKFEFYTLLANEHVVANEPVANQPTANQLVTSVVPALPIATARAKPSTDATAPMTLTVSPSRVALTKPLPVHPEMKKESYLLQVAAFTRRQDAERVKASFLLKGFGVQIAVVTQRQTSWYRVMVGPFASRAQAQKAQVSIARSDHVVGMIRKMDA